jgi:hypothetical protein
MIVLGRKSKSDASAEAPRLLRDPNVPVGQTATPLVFKDQKAAKAYMKENGVEGFIPLSLGAPRPSGNKK